MSVRLRAIVVVLFVAIVASGATAWFTVRALTGAAQETVAASDRDLADVTTALQRYTATHRDWSSITPVAQKLARSTDQRVRLVDGEGRLVADSAAANPTSSSSRTPGSAAPSSSLPHAAIDARLQMPLPADRRLGQGTTARTDLNYLSKWAIQQAADATARLDQGVCVGASGAEFRLGRDGSGWPTFTPVPPTCASLPAPAVSVGGAVTWISRCHDGGGTLLACAGDYFTGRVAAQQPIAIQVYVGDEQTPVSLPVLPAYLAAAVVALVTILAGLLLGRGVVRPVEGVTAAARRLAGGDLTERAPARGRGELAKLATAFNQMADSLATAEERQRRLVADIAHELRSPLSTLRGYLEAIGDGIIEPTPELIASLQEEVRVQQRIIEDLQDLSLAESGALTYHRADVDVDALLAGVCRAYQQQAAARGTRLVAEPPTGPRAASDGPAPTITADPARLRQVLGNLVTNALRAVAEEGGDVRLWCEQGGQRVLLHVTDNGRGMTTREAAHAFDRFWRADPARGRDTGGSGLGLAVVRQIVLDHGGDVTIHSTPGAGCDVVIALPAET